MIKIAEIKMSQKKQSEVMEKILKEKVRKNTYRTQIRKYKKCIQSGNTRKRKEDKNLIIVGYKHKMKNNQELKNKLEDFNSRALKVNAKIRNAIKLSKQGLHD